jgi:hypothetical protein
VDGGAYDAGIRERETGGVSGDEDGRRERRIGRRTEAMLAIADTSAVARAVVAAAMRGGGGFQVVRSTRRDDKGLANSVGADSWRTWGHPWVY